MHEKIGGKDYVFRKVDKPYPSQGLQDLIGGEKAKFGVPKGIPFKKKCLKGSEKIKDGKRSVVKIPNQGKIGQIETERTTARATCE